MNDLGVFGGSVADEPNGVPGEDEAGAPMGPGGFGGGMDGMGMGGMGGGMRNRGLLMEKDAAETQMAMAPPTAPMDGAPMSGAMVMHRAAGLAAKPGAAAPLVQPTIRTKFADTALWVGQLTTASNGTAEVELNMPENLTTWRIKVWGMGFGTRVGQGQTDVVTRKDLIVRLEAPRFFVQSDEVVLSAVVHNYLKTAKKVEVSLDLYGKCLAYRSVCLCATVFIGCSIWNRMAGAVRALKSPRTPKPASIGPSECTTKARPPSA